MPKNVRERLGFTPGAKLELVETDGRLEISPAPTPMRLETRDGELVAVPDRTLPVLTADQVREVVEAQRR